MFFLNAQREVFGFLKTCKLVGAFKKKTRYSFFNLLWPLIDQTMQHWICTKFKSDCLGVIDDYARWNRHIHTKTSPLLDWIGLVAGWVKTIAMSKIVFKADGVNDLKIRKISKVHWLHKKKSNRSYDWFITTNIVFQV